MSDVVVCDGLVKEFGSFRALDGLDLVVRPAEVHGFLGPNGAGKSVTIRTLLGLLRKTDGSVEVFGQDPWRDAVALHRRLAYVPGDTNLWPNLTGGEILDYLERLRGVRNPALRAELTEHFQLDPAKKARTYSKGNRQKVALIAALSTGAELMIFDEPTNGLDPLMEAVFQERITEAVAGGSTVLLSSHILSEVERLCQRVTIIRNGTTVESGLLSDLRGLSATTIVAELETALADGDVLSRIGGVQHVQVDGAAVTVEVETSGITAVTAVLAEHGILRIESRGATLEQLFMQHYGDEPTGTGAST